MRLFSALSFVIGLTAIEFSSVFAAPCQSGQIRSSEEAFEESSAIFLGRVIQLKELSLKGLRYEEITIEVDSSKSYKGEVFKGESYFGKLDKSVSLVMPLETEDRQLLRVGSTYLMHAVEEPQLERLFTSLCWRNSLISEDQDHPDLVWLRNQFNNETPKDDS